MKKRGNRNIPDFSRKAPQKGGPAAQPDMRGDKAPPPPPVANIKPQATSAKSGRRGT